jgi:hypothetical protein
MQSGTLEQFGKTHADAAGDVLNLNPDSRPLPREHLAREAVLLTFLDPLPDRCSRLFDLSPTEWTSLLRLLDFSGLALYFLDRMIELDVCD